MAQCGKCRAEVAVYDHRCPKCGANVRGNEVRPSSDRAKARWCHLIALPGMVFAVVPIPWLFTLGPFCIIVLLVLRSLPETSPTVRQHLTEALNFQLPWLAAMYLLMALSILAGIAFYVLVWFGGIILVLFKAYDAGNGSDGKYLVRLPMFK